MDHVSHAPRNVDDPEIAWELRGAMTAWPTLPRLQLGLL